MRAFIALPLPEPTLDALCTLQDSLRVGRAVDPDALHLTLAFLEDQPEEVLEDLHAELDLLRQPAQMLDFRGVDCFGGDAPRVLFASVEPAPELLALHRAVWGAIRRAGLRLPKGRFRPHVTLARLKPHDARGVAECLRDHAGFRHVTPPIPAFALYRSELRPDGARHAALAEYPLIPLEG